MSTDNRGRIRLSIGQHVEIHKAVNEEYAKSNLSDDQFAAMLSKRLGFQLTKSHVQSARETYGIQGNGTRGERNAEGVTKGAVARISELEKSVAQLKEYVSVLMKFKTDLEK